MGSVTETRIKLLDVPAVIEDVYFALQNEDYEDLQILQELVEKIYNDLSPRLRDSFIRVLVRNLDSRGLHEQRDLNGFFSKIVRHEVPEFQRIRE